MTRVRRTTSATERRRRSTTAHASPIAKSVQISARRTATAGRMRSPLPFTTRSPMTTEPSVRPPDTSQHVAGRAPR